MENAEVEKVHHVETTFSVYTIRIVLAPIKCILIVLNSGINCSYSSQCNQISI